MLAMPSLPQANVSNGYRQRKRGRESTDASSTTWTPKITDSARLTYEELLQSPARDPPKINFNPILHEAVINPSDVALLPPHGEASESLPPIFLMRKNKPIHGYALIEKNKISLDHHGQDWGCIMFGVAYKHLSKQVFQTPTQRDAKYVAIKRLKKSVVTHYLELGGREDPYKEIALMQELGDNIHVLSCIEALQDDTYLYIITPRACSEGTLKDSIPWFKDNIMESSRAKKIFTKILDILLYLEEHDICHRDMSPDNFIFLTPDNLVVFDLALSIKIPRDETGKRTLITPQGTFGTRPYMAPEIFRNRVFDGVACDLYAAGIVLYNLLTNHVLFYLPHPSDISFLYFVLAKGLSSTPLNERTVEILMDIKDKQAQHSEILKRAMAHLNLSARAVQLLEKMVTVAPAQRYTLAQVIESDYVRSDDD